MTEAIGLEFEAPSGERLRFEWRADELTALAPEPSAEPVWRLGGELDRDQVDLVRVLSAKLGDGRLLALVALRPAGAGGHGEELVAAALGDGASFSQLDQALFSAEYDADGMPRRIGLELYESEDGLPIRIAADVTAVAGSQAGEIKRLSAALTVAGSGGTAALDLLQRA